MSERDPRKEPKVWDVVRPIAALQKWEVKVTELTVQVVCGNAVGFTVGADERHLDWVTKDGWCAVNDSIIGWEVLHAAD